MAGGQERVLRRRIKSVQSTKKITRAMELIAGSRIVKAQARVHAAVPYANGITDVVRNLAAAGAGGKNPLLAEPAKLERVLQVPITADRGLCGGYNTTVIRATEGEMKKFADQGAGYALVTVGRRAQSYFQYRNYEIGASFEGFSQEPTYEDARAIARWITPRFLAGEFDLVQLVYTRFISSGSQELVVRPLMPLGDDDDFDPKAAGNAGDADGAEKVSADYEFEPSPDGILDDLLPRYAEARIYAALLNAAASEHAARQRAMKAATDNADELIRTLSRVMNRARQDAITNEIMEIVGGAEAMNAGVGVADEAPNA